MRTTIDVPDELYRTVKVMAAERGATLRELVLEGLHMVMRAKQTTAAGFELPEIPYADDLDRSAGAG